MVQTQACEQHEEFDFCQSSKKIDEFHERQKLLDTFPLKFVYFWLVHA